MTRPSLNRPSLNHPSLNKKKGPSLNRLSVGKGVIPAGLPSDASWGMVERLAEAELMSRSLHRYLRGMWSIIEPGREFMDNWHIGAISEVLEAVTNFELKTVVINIPPRTTKSVTVCVAWPTWVWTRAQNEKTQALGAASRFLCTSHDGDLATRDAVRSRRVIESEWYQQRWGHVFKLTTDQNVKTNYENDKTGHRVTETVGSSVIGKGGDYRIIDDPHKTESQESDTVRESKLSWLKEEFSTRFIDPQRNGLVLIMQRIHERDMSGFMLAEQWADYHLCIPMRYEAHRKIYIPRDPTKTLNYGFPTS